MTYSATFPELHHISRELPDPIQVEISNRQYASIVADVKRLKGDDTGRLTVDPRRVYFPESTSKPPAVVTATLVYNRSHISLQGYMYMDMEPWCSPSIPFSELAVQDTQASCGVS